MVTMSETRLRMLHPLNSVERCPHCGVARPTLEFKHSIYHSSSGQYSSNHWLCYRCTSCGNPIQFLASVPDDMSGNLPESLVLRAVYSEQTIPAAALEDLDDWPDRAATYYRQGLNAVGAPDAAVMVAGSSVDAMLKDKGYEEGSVYARINEAVEDRVLTPDMGEWAHSVRLAANNPRHADLSSPHATFDEAKAALEFVRSLGLFLYVLPAQVRRGKEQAKQATKIES